MSQSWTFRICRPTDDVVKHWKAHHPHGMQDFACGLCLGDVPQDLFGIGYIGNQTHQIFSTAQKSSPDRNPDDPYKQLMGVIEVCLRR